MSSNVNDFVNISAAFDESCSEGDPWIVTLVSQDDTIRLDTRLDEELMKSIAERGNEKMEGAIERAKWRNGAQAASMARAVYKFETLACIAKDEEDFEVRVSFLTILVGFVWCGSHRVQRLLVLILSLVMQEDSCAMM